MGRQYVLLSCLALSVMFATAWSADNQDETPVGKRVMVTRWNAELKTGQTVVAKLPLGTLLDVSQVNGSWMWISSAKGWIHERDTVPLDGAIAHFTSEVTRTPSSKTYHERGVARVAMGDHEEGISDFSKAIELDAKNLSVRNDRGNAYRRLKKLDEALADFNVLMEAGVRHPGIYTNRGLVWHAKASYDKALADFDAALRIDAKYAPAWESGGAAREAKGDFQNAIANYSQAIRIAPTFHQALNNLAWLLATHPDDKLRDGTQAVAHATKACELTGYGDSGYLDTLAAALAEVGQFEKAVMRAEEAIEKASGAQKAAIQERLKLYASRHAFRRAK